MELLNKIFNNLTTRSNTFAVWLTVGFFQITNDTMLPNATWSPRSTPPTGRNIRHHMFAIVDRTQINDLHDDDQESGYGSATPAAPVPIGFLRGLIRPTMRDRHQLVTDPRPEPRLDGTSGNYPRVHSWSMSHPGQPNEETVVIQPGYTANFTYNHVVGSATSSVAAIQGRWTQGSGYNLTTDASAGVVPYWVIID